MTSHLHLRPASNNDRDEIIAVVASILDEYGLPYEPDGSDADLNDIDASYTDVGGFFMLLVDEVDRIAGTFGVMPVDGTTCKLRKMYLLPETRGCGNGRTMLTYAMTEARRRGFTTMILETKAILVDAIRLYERSGFTKHGGPTVSSRCDQIYRRSLDDIPYTDQPETQP